MLTKEDLFHRLNYLVPNAKFAFWENVDPTNRGYEAPYIIQDIQDWRVVWYPGNLSPIPTLEELLAITDEQIEEYQLQLIKTERNERYSNNLGVIAAFQTYKIGNPQATFSEYLDILESFRESISGVVN